MGKDVVVWGFGGMKIGEMKIGEIKLIWQRGLRKEEGLSIAPVHHSFFSGNLLTEFLNRRLHGL